VTDGGGRAPESGPPPMVDGCGVQPDAASVPSAVR
jgi:hypothetical protein